VSTVEKIEAEIAKLSPKEVAQLTRWLVEYDATLWDKQLKEDSKNGRPDRVWKKAEAEIGNGQAKPLDASLLVATALCRRAASELQGNRPGCRPF